MGANMILTIGAILLFGVFLNSSNKLMIGNNQIAAQNEYYVTALSLGQSVIDEAKMKAFDEKIIGIPLGSAKVDTVTAVGSMGTDKVAEVAANPDVAGAQKIGEYTPGRRILCISKSILCERSQPGCRFCHQDVLQKNERFCLE
jgi:hypothetical protein